MAAKTFDTTELETAAEAGVCNPGVLFKLLNMLRVANGKAVYPDRSYCTDHKPAVTGPALAGIQADLNA
ncbi:hypothetical protein ACFYUL_23940 [Streptomyces sp. NPDC004311]|uniref:hypothetical protein n=1 Tax=Streptomyces sp. NPDC004311 TaxID=3364698 RepID=UPI0036CB3E3A